MWGEANCYHARHSVINLPIFITLSVRHNQILHLLHDGFCGLVQKVDCSPVVGLLPAILGRKLVEAAPVDADDDPGVKKEGVRCLEVADVFESGTEARIVSGAASQHGAHLIPSEDEDEGGVDNGSIEGSVVCHEFVDALYSIEGECIKTCPTSDITQHQRHMLTSNSPSIMLGLFRGKRLVEAMV